MAILKMDVLGNDTTWLPEVDKVISKFYVNPQEEPLPNLDQNFLVTGLVLQRIRDMGREDLFEDLKKHDYFVSVPEYYLDKVVLLKVHRNEDVEFWLAPQGRTYLMTNDGKTIDRI